MEVKVKKVTVLAILFLLCVSMATANTWSFSMGYKWMSDYVYKCIPFLRHNLMAHMFGFSAAYEHNNGDNSSGYFYYAGAEEYLEFGADLWLNFKASENTTIGFTAFPFLWRFAVLVRQQSTELPTAPRLSKKEDSSAVALE